MTNNDLLRRLRYTFNYNDKRMVAIFASTDREVTREQVSNWMKKDDDPAYDRFKDVDLACFLNGLINHKRGKREGEQPEPETRLNNNIILRKLKIALDMQAEDILAVLSLVNMPISKHELSAFFRKPEHKHFRACKEQVLRNFIHGLQLKYRPKEPVEIEAEVKVEVEVEVATDVAKNEHIWGQGKK